MSEMDRLTTRIQILESRFRQMKIIAVVACIILGTLGVMGQAPGRPSDVFPSGRPRVENQAGQQSNAIENEIRSRHFVLVDQSDKERASIAADAAGSVFLVMFDATGKPRASLSVTPQGPSLVLSDPTGQARTVLGSTSLLASRISDNGIVERAPPSSIILFDRAGRLLHRTP
jgi:hypothetical protein